jgi:hypothetical protein
LQSASTDEINLPPAVKKPVLKKQKDCYVATTNEILRELKQSFPAVLSKLPKNPKKSLIKDVCIKSGVIHSIDERVALKRALVSRKMSKKLNFDNIG